MNETHLLWANLAVWLGICGYVALLAAKAARLTRRVERLELLGNDEERP